MNNMPTKNDVVRFLKDKKKTIAFTTLLVLGVYLVGIFFAMMQKDKPTLPNVSDPEFSEVEELITKERLTKNTYNKLTELEKEYLMEKLQENAAYFSFYVETSKDESLNDSGLLEELFLSQEAVSQIDSKTKKAFVPVLSVDVVKQEDSDYLNLFIATGNPVKNKEIARTYKKMLEEKSLAFLENKNVYILADIKIKEMDSEGLDAEKGGVQNNNVESTSFLSSPRRTAVLSVAVLVFGIMLGILIAILQDMKQKEIHSLYTLPTKLDDTIIDLTAYKASQQEKELAHAILYPMHNVKVVLTDNEVPNSVLESLHAYGTVTQSGQNGEGKGTHTHFYVTDVLHGIRPDVIIDEIILIVEVGKTSKRWYEKNRVLLENYESELKIIRI